MDECDDLPNEYDAIVIGTGLVECIVAAAVSRAGKKVLHLDPNSYYGAEWATVGLDGLLDICKEASKTEETTSEATKLHDDLTTVNFRNFNPIQAAAFQWYQIPSTPAPHSEEHSVVKEDTEPMLVDSPKEDEKTDTQNSHVSEESDEKSACHSSEDEIKPLSREEILKQSRKFNIDLAPKVVYSRGPMVQTLLQSGVSRYVEFMSVQTLALVADRIERVPATKSEVFASRAVSPLEKRALMATVSGLADALNQEDCAEEYFFDRLTKAGLPPRLAPYISAMAGGEPMSSNAATRLKEFLSSAGRFAASPLLWPLFGSGELLQAFARLAAVYGAIYWLGRGAESFVVGKTGAAEGIISRGRLLRCQNVVVPAYRIPGVVNDTTISRVIILADKPLAAYDREAILHFAPNPQDKPVRLLQLSHYTSACPPPFCLFHITGENENSVMQCIDALFCRGQVLESEGPKSQTLEKPVCEWMTTPTQISEVDVSEKPNVHFLVWLSVASVSIFNASDLSEGVQVCPSPDSNLDFPNVISQAEKIFKKMYPEEEFLPIVPDPEEALECDGNLVEGAPEEEAFPSEETQEDSSMPGKKEEQVTTSGGNLEDPCEKTDGLLASTKDSDDSSTKSIPVKVSFPTEDDS